MYVCVCALLCVLYTNLPTFIVAALIYYCFVLETVVNFCSRIVARVVGKLLFFPLRYRSNRTLHLNFTYVCAFLVLVASVFIFECIQIICILAAHCQCEICFVFMKLNTFSFFFGMAWKRWNGTQSNRIHFEIICSFAILTSVLVLSLLWFSNFITSKFSRSLFF